MDGFWLVLTVWAKTLVATLFVMGVLWLAGARKARSR